MLRSIAAFVVGLVFCGCADRPNRKLHYGEAEVVWTSEVDILAMLKDSAWEPPTDFLQKASARSMDVRKLAQMNVGEVINAVGKALRNAGSTWRLVVVVEQRDVSDVGPLRNTPFEALLANANLDSREKMSPSEVIWVLRNELALGVRYKHGIVYLGQRFN